MTLTTEQLREIMCVYGNKHPCYLAAAECLANREEQPMQVTDEMALAFHRALNDGGIAEADLEEIKVGLRAALCNVTVPPAFPERLPCPVRIMPGLLFGKGVPTESMLNALNRREEYEAELEAMAPEQRAENDARLERLNALIPQPSPPAMPGIITASMAAEKAFRLGAVLNSSEAEQFAEGWNACRAAMLAQPVSGGYKLPPHLYRELVNSLRDTAVKFSGTEQLRERLNTALSQFIEPDHPHTRTVAP